jgi:hypothetical protein
VNIEERLRDIDIAQIERDVVNLKRFVTQFMEGGAQLRKGVLLICERRS